MARSTAAPEPRQRDDWTPQPTFTSCVTCGALVLWENDERRKGWVTPALGMPHRCPEQGATP